MSKQLMVGSVAVGGGAPVSIQSMCNTKTDDVEATVAQIHHLEEAGCEFYYVTDEEREAIREKLNDVTLDYISEYGDQSTIDLVRSLA